MLSPTFLKQFVPEQWSWAQKFAAFMGIPFRIDTELVVGTSAVLAHKEKYELLARVANEYAARIQDDHEELDKVGYTPALRAKAFAALTEALLAEQYSILDGLRRVVYSAFRGVRGIQNKSTNTFFERAAADVYGAEFPAPLREALTSAHTTWFPRLRLVRTLTTHGETGTCYMNPETKMISYWHMASARSGGQHLRIEDIVEFGNTTYLSIVGLTELFFRVFYLALEPIERRQGCGVYKGRFYERLVAASPTLGFNDGRCFSRAWFETEAGHDCPLRHACAAYEHPVSPEERVRHFPAG